MLSHDDVSVDIMSDGIFHDAVLRGCDLQVSHWCLQDDQGPRGSGKRIPRKTQGDSSFLKKHRAIVASSKNTGR